jgi:hypothetical protein
LAAKNAPAFARLSRLGGATLLYLGPYSPTLTRSKILLRAEELFREVSESTVDGLWATSCVVIRR